MSCGCRDGKETWTTPEAMHLDVRGLEPPQPMIEVLRLIDSGDAADVLVVHLDREPIYLYPELDDRGWSHDMLTDRCGDPDCQDEVRLRLTRMR
jgi:Uncharacterized conserved protein (DUF2249)